MLVKNKSRGQRQRITKRIKVLRGETPSKDGKKQEHSAKEKIENMLKKRE